MSSAISSPNVPREPPRLGALVTLFLAPAFIFANMYTTQAILPIVIFGLGLLASGMFSTVAVVNLYLGEQATTAKGTAASMYLSLYYFGGSFGAVLPGLALIWAGWPGVALLCLGMVLIALAADGLLCR